MSLSLAEELLLLALKDERGTVVLAASSALPYGLARAVLEDKPADSRTMMLLSLVRACDLIGEVFPGPEKKDARKKIKALVSNEAIGNAAAAQIEEIVEAMIMASTVSSVAASS